MVDKLRLNILCSLGIAKNLHTIFLAISISMVSLWAFAPKVAVADFINGEQLGLYCASQDPTDDAVCVVYITGAVDAFTTAELIAEKSTNFKRTICIPEDIGPQELKDVTSKWLRRPESNLKFAATLLILGAIRNEYSC